MLVHGCTNCFEAEAVTIGFVGFTLARCMFCGIGLGVGEDRGVQGNSSKNPLQFSGTPLQWHWFLCNRKSYTKVCWV